MKTVLDRVKEIIAMVVAMISAGETELEPRVGAAQIIAGFADKLATASHDQLIVVEKALKGNFDTMVVGGKPGTGKTWTLQLVRDLLEAVFNTRVIVVAPTGLASQNAGGHGTINRVFGLGQKADLLPTEFPSEPKIRGTFRRQKVDEVLVRAMKNIPIEGHSSLIVMIDEMSMCSSELMLLVWQIARQLMHSSRPVKFILWGDLLQLKRVVDSKPLKSLQRSNELYDPAQFVNGGNLEKHYGSPLSSIGPFEIIPQEDYSAQELKLKQLPEKPWRLVELGLVINHRQGDDLMFGNAIAKIRIGYKLLDKCLKERIGKMPSNPKEAVYVYHRRQDVVQKNKEMVNEVPADKKRFYHALIDYMGIKGRVSGVTLDEKPPFKIVGLNVTCPGRAVRIGGLTTGVETVERELTQGLEWLSEVEPIQPIMEIAVGLPFMVTENLPELGVFNGTVGIVKELHDDGIVIAVGKTKKHVELKMMDLKSVPVDSSGNAVAGFKQLPGVMAVAITGHKVQGQTFDSVPVVVTIDRSNIRALSQTPGWVCVVLSRCTRLENLYIQGDANVISQSICVDPAAVLYMDYLENRMLRRMWEYGHTTVCVANENGQPIVVNYKGSTVNSGLCKHHFELANTATGDLEHVDCVYSQGKCHYCLPDGTEMDIYLKWRQMMEEFIAVADTAATVVDVNNSSEELVVNKLINNKLINNKLEFVVKEDKVLIGGHEFLLLPAGENQYEDDILEGKLISGELLLSIVGPPDEQRPRTAWRVMATVENDIVTIMPEEDMFLVFEVHDAVKYAAYLEQHPENFATLCQHVVALIMDAPSIEDEDEDEDEDEGGNIPSITPKAPTGGGGNATLPPGIIAYLNQSPKAESEEIVVNTPSGGKASSSKGVSTSEIKVTLNFDEQYFIRIDVEGISVEHWFDSKFDEHFEPNPLFPPGDAVDQWVWEKYALEVPLSNAIKAALAKHDRSKRLYFWYDTNLPLPVMEMLKSFGFDYSDNETADAELILYPDNDGDDSNPSSTSPAPSEGYVDLEFTHSNPISAGHAEYVEEWKRLAANAVAFNKTEEVAWEDEAGETFFAVLPLPLDKLISSMTKNDLEFINRYFFMPIYEEMPGLGRENYKSANQLWYASNWLALLFEEHMSMLDLVEEGNCILSEATNSREFDRVILESSKYDSQITPDGVDGLVLGFNTWLYNLERRTLITSLQGLTLRDAINKIADFLATMQIETDVVLGRHWHSLNMNEHFKRFYHLFKEAYLLKTNGTDCRIILRRDEETGEILDLFIQKDDDGGTSLVRSNPLSSFAPSALDQTIPGIIHRPGFLSEEDQTKVLELVKAATAKAEHTSFKKGGYTYTCLGDYYWVFNQGAPKYLTTQPSGAPIVAIPAELKTLVENIVNVAYEGIFPGVFEAQSCPVHTYKGQQTLAAHQDKTEEIDAPIVSLSFGATGLFRAGGKKRDLSDSKEFVINSGDLFIMYGPQRLCFHSYMGAVDPSFDSERINLTFRMVRVSLPPAPKKHEKWVPPAVGNPRTVAKTTKPVPGFLQDFFNKSDEKEDNP